MRLLISLPLLWAPSPDGWFGADKVKHFLASAFIQSVAFSSLEAAGADRRTALAGASLATAAAGVGKELLDRRRGGEASLRDLAWDAAGAGAATVFLLRTER